MSAFEIVDDIELPALVRAPHSRESKYPFAQLNVGQGFKVPYEEGVDPAQLARRMSQSARLASKKTEHKYSIRRGPDGVVCKRVK